MILAHTRRRAQRTLLLHALIREKAKLQKRAESGAPRYKTISPIDWIYCFKFAYNNNN